MKDRRAAGEYGADSMISRLLPALLACLLGVSSARAAATCTGPEIAADAETSERWPAAASAVRGHLEKVEGLDRCARVDLVAGGKEIVVVVTLRDGRTAIRRVANVDELGEVVEALLVLPIAEEPEPVRPPPPPVVARPAPAPARVEPKAPASTKNGGFEIGVGGAERASGSSLYVGLGVTMHAHLTYGAWHVGVSARSDAINAPARNADSDPVRLLSSAIGIGSGRRFNVGALDLDLIGGIALVVQQQDLLNRDERSPADEAAAREHHEQFSPRLTTVARLSQSSAKVRVYIASDIEVGNPYHGKDPPQPFVEWPFWSFGVTFGVLWSTR
jgi:hypothetical protein